MNIYHTTKANGKTPKVPLSRPPWRIALVANLQDDFERGLDDPPDAGAEFDRRETLWISPFRLEFAEGVAFYILERGP